jgi:hypothetical protein
MQKLVIAVVMLCVSLMAYSAVNGVPISGNSVLPITNGYYCNAAAPTVPVAPYIAPALVQPISGAASSIEATDGTYFYVITMTTGTGLVTSLPSCPVRYSTQQ